VNPKQKRRRAEFTAALDCAKGLVALAEALSPAESSKPKMKNATGE